MIGEKIDKRRIFTPEERQQILKNTYGICACCGKKLTNKTLRVEHIIPLSRGGKNEMANLTALCESCNTLKDNKIYMPYDFYSALRDKPRFHEMEHYVRDWFQTIKDDFDLERFPLISFNVVIQLDPVQNAVRRKEMGFNRQLLYKWTMLGQDTYREVERTTGINISELRTEMRQIKHLNLAPPKNHPIPLYGLRKVTTNKLLAVIAVCYCKNRCLSIEIPWHCAGKVYIRSMVYNFVKTILSSLDLIAGDSIPEYSVSSKYPEALEAFQMLESVPELVGTSVKMGYYQSIEDETDRMYMAEISRRPNIQDIRPTFTNSKET